MQNLHPHPISSTQLGFEDSGLLISYSNGSQSLCGPLPWVSPPEGEAHHWCVHHLGVWLGLGLTGGGIQA